MRRPQTLRLPRSLQVDAKAGLRVSLRSKRDLCPATEDTGQSSRESDQRSCRHGCRKDILRCLCLSQAMSLGAAALQNEPHVGMVNIEGPKARGDFHARQCHCETAVAPLDEIVPTLCYMIVAYTLRSNRVFAKTNGLHWA